MLINNLANLAVLRRNLILRDGAGLANGSTLSSELISRLGTMALSDSGLGGSLDPTTRIDQMELANLLRSGGKKS